MSFTVTNEHEVALLFVMQRSPAPRSNEPVICYRTVKTPKLIKLPFLFINQV